VFHYSTSYQVSCPWQPGLHVVPLKFMTLLIVADTGRENKKSNSDIITAIIAYAINYGQASNERPGSKTETRPWIVRDPGIPACSSASSH
jgi:hypothetical protein